MKRKQLILASLKLQNGENYCPYILRESEMELLKKMLVAKQLPIFSFHKANEGDIGGFVPIAIMHEVKKQEVEQSNQEVNKRLSSALKRLIHSLNDDKRKRL